MHVKDSAVGHQSASFLVDTDIEMLVCLICRDEALLVMNCRTRMAAEPGGGAANLHATTVAGKTRVLRNLNLLVSTPDHNGC